MRTIKKQLQSPISLGLIRYTRIVTLLLLFPLLISYVFALDFHKHSLVFILCGGMILLLTVFVEKTNVLSLLTKISVSRPYTQSAIQKLRGQKRLYRLYITKLSRLSKRMKVNFVNKVHLVENAPTRESREVLTDQAQRNTRSNDLYLAHLLFQKSKKEVTLVFQFMGFKRRVKTSIWHLDTNNIKIKGGMLVSISSVYKVEF